MARQQCKSTANAVLLCIVLLSFTILTVNGIVNNKIDRIIDLSTQLVKITERIHLDTATSLYNLKIQQSHLDQLAFIDASMNGQTLNLVAKPDGVYEINTSGQSVDQPLIITSVFTKLLEPYPSEISQNERQLVRYAGSQTTLSPYLTKTITTRIKLPANSRLESFSKASKMTTGTNKLTYGPFKDVQPYQADVLHVHFENNSPFIAVNDMQRSVELSPWAGYVNVANEVKIMHVGAKLKGPFSRFEYQRDPSYSSNSVKQFSTILPKLAKDIYFRDGIGNISTSSYRTTSTQTIVNIRPRFPIFGGWGTDFKLGYRVNMAQFVNEPASGNQYRMSLPLVDTIFDSMFIEEATVRIYLPAGSGNVELVSSPTGVQRLNDEINYSYMDVVGRPVVVLKMSNIVAQHLEGKPLVIRYSYNKMYMLQEPLYVLAASLVLFIIGAILSKMSSETSTSYRNKLKSD